LREKERECVRVREGEIWKESEERREGDSERDIVR
jgi:hypothetical protein